MRCRNCSKSLAGSEKFCPFCGTKQENSASQDSITPIPYQNAESETAQQEDLPTSTEELLEKTAKEEHTAHQALSSESTDPKKETWHSTSNSLGENAWPTQSLHVQKNSTRKITIPLKGKSSAKQRVRRTPKKGVLLAAAIPAVSLFLVTGGTFAYGASQNSINSKVAKLHQQAELNSKQGNFLQAHEAVKEALQLRPEQEQLKREEAQLSKAAGMQQSLKEISASMDKEKFEEAAGKLEEVKNSMVSGDGKLLESLQKEADRQEGILKTAKAEKEALSTDDVDKLGEMLGNLDSFSSEKTGETRKAILSRIVQVTKDQTDALTKEGKFEEAGEVISKAMRYDSKNKELSSLMDDLFKKEEEFPGTLQPKMYKGKAKASGGELAGKSTPLSFSSIKAQTNEYGDINISGTMVNKTKKTMRLLTIYLKFYDEKGNFLKNEIVYADQIQIKSGAKGSFKTVIYDLNTEGMYKVDQVTWNEE